MTNAPTSGPAQLAEAVRTRRLALNLPIKRAADMASISKDTWLRVENAALVRDITYAKIEATLGWEAGSIRHIVDGKEPTLIGDEPGPGLTATRPPVEDFTQILTSALVAVADNLTGAEIREVAHRTTEEMQRRGLL